MKVHTQHLPSVGGLLVTGTGTGVGKSVVSAALLAAIVADGRPARAYKPVVTGLEEPLGEWPPDHELLAAVAGMAPEDVAPLRYGPAVSPHLAAELAGERIDPEQVVASALAALRVAEQPPSATQQSPSSAQQSPPAAQQSIPAAQQSPPAGEAGVGATLIVEGVGGLLVPLTERFTVRDFAVRVGLPLLIAAAPGLGTINHTLLTVEAARAVGLEVRAVVLTPWPAQPSAMERSNRDTIARLGNVEVATLDHVQAPEPHALARAGDRLPWQRWLAGESSVSSCA